MKIRLLVYDAGGATLHDDAWHVPNDLPATLAAVRYGAAWASAQHDLPRGADMAECRWWIELCFCLRCQTPAASLPEPSWPKAEGLMPR